MQTKHPFSPRPPVQEEDWIASLSDAIQEGLLRLCTSRLKAFAALMLFALVCFLPGFNSIPPVDRDEARFAQASKQMIETGDYVDIRFQEGTRYKKPVGIYWMQAGSAQATGMGAEAPIWAYRIPSLIGALIAVGFTFLIGMRMASVRVGFLAGLGMAACILLGVEARLAKTDAMLLASIMAVQWLIWELYDHQNGLTPKQAIIFWLALAVGVLVKGPIILMVAGLTIAGLSIQERSVRWLSGAHYKWGVPAFFLLIMPWFIAIGIHTDWSFYIDSIGKDMLAKVATGKESHGAPPGTYLGVSLATFWPVSIFFILALPSVWAERKRKAVRFALTWIIPTWIIFELVPTKLPHYILPVLPAMAVLTIHAMECRATEFSALWARLFALLVPLVAIVLGVGAPIGLIVLEGTVLPASLGLGLVAAALAVLSYSVLRKGRVIAAFVLACLITPILYLNVHGAIFPAFKSVWLSSALVEEANRVKSCETVELASIGYTEPSLVFLGGTDLKFLNAERGAHFITEAGCRVALVERRQNTAFMEALGEKANLIQKSSTIEGYKLNGGKWQSFGLYQLKLN